MLEFSYDVVDLARKDLLDPVIGRGDEIRQITEILSKKTKSNAMLVGKPGVGKTAIINGIEQLIARGECKILEGYKIYNVDVGSLVAGTKHRGEFEKKFSALIQEAQSNNKAILFIDEIHTLLGAGRGGGSLDASNMLKPGLANGTLKIIGATTYDEYRKYVTKDAAFERRFVKVNIKEPSAEDTLIILRGLKASLETHHGVRISDKAMKYAVSVGKKYIPNRRFPDLAIDLIDTACASAIISLNSEPLELIRLTDKLWSLELEKTGVELDIKRDPSLEESLLTVDLKIEEIKKLIAPIEDAYNSEKGHLIEARDIKRKLEQARNLLEKAKRENDKKTAHDIQNTIIPFFEERLKEFAHVEEIKPIHVAEVLSRQSGIPIARLAMKENEKLLVMYDRIKSKIFGQYNAVETVVNSILASKVSLKKDKKPIGSFLFLGPTGVGKTELSKIICEELNDTYENMVILDMSDYSSEISKTKLIGAPAGYVGCDDGGTLTEPIKECPYNVVLLDELDLAHRSNLNILYQLLDEGRVVDGRGVKVLFQNTVIIMTSNLGQEYITDKGSDIKKIEGFTYKNISD
ncbi:chaperone protein ClpB-like [Arctopsyche grandis]|uniref:chaperone protein ClpB-like n=1 Tax=Arctopsyche grandis TaxID=121162 RepID=UPI00406D74A2